MSYSYVYKERTDYKAKEKDLTLEDAAVRFLHESCEGLRFDYEIEEAEKTENKLQGISNGKPDQQNRIPYNMEMESDRLCLENAVKRFLKSGNASDAFDVYFCFIEMFICNYGDANKLIEMLSEYESNGSSLLMKHRDHYSHSVYVFILGLAIYETNSKFRSAYKKYYGIENDKAAAHRYLRFWGISSLFHDIGYAFELPFEQVKAYFQVRGLKEYDEPFLAYHNIEKLTDIPSHIGDRFKELYNIEKNCLKNTNQLFAYDLETKLGKKYHFSKQSMEAVLASKPINPDIFGYFIDHAYFSANSFFQECVRIYANLGNEVYTLESELAKAKKAFEEAVEEQRRTCKQILLKAEYMLSDIKRNYEEFEKMFFSKDMIDALTAIILHNSLYKFSIAFYKDDINIPFDMELHPIAYMLMLCDELQCWDRTAYGRNSRIQLHPMNCRFVFNECSIHATYIFDDAEKDKIDKFEQAYKQNPKTELKAYSEMVNGNKFLEDIKRIVNADDLGIIADVKIEKANHKNKRTFLSTSNFIHLYNFAVALNARYNYSNNLDILDTLNSTDIKKLEYDFNTLSLEYKMSNVGQAKAFSEFLDKIDCFYTDKPVDFNYVNEFDEEDIQTIAPLEHKRWLIEHREMGWKHGDRSEINRTHPLMIDCELTEAVCIDHYNSLEEDDKGKDYKPFKAMLKLIKHYDGLRIYRIKEK